MLCLGMAQVSEGDVALLGQLCVQMGFRRAESPEKDAAAYISGASPEILDNYPELGLFRDIVFYFKLMMCSSIDDLPPIQRWEARDAGLRWSFEPVMSGLPGFRSASAMSLKVEGFGRRLSAVRQRKQEPGMLARFMQSRPKPRAPPSGADLELIVEPGIVTEDDVLHVPNSKLPSFGGRLSFSDSELLCTYLTAPYLRIPLLVEFFREESRLRALECQELQNILDSCFFEPGGWIADADKRLPEKIPSEDAGLTSTPFGLLNNELMFCWRPLLEGLEDMFKKALDFDTGSFLGQSSPVILYMIRLLVRVEEYIHGVVDLINLKAGVAISDRQSGSDACAAVLMIDNTKLAQELCEEGKKLTSLLRGRAFTMLEQWRSKLGQAGNDDNLSDVCEVLGHMALIFRSAERDSAFNDIAVKTLLTSQVFLTHNFAFNLDAKAVQNSGTKISAEYLQKVERLEFFFALVQKNRRRVLEWIEPADAGPEHNKSKVGAILEETIAVLTGKGRLSKDGTCEGARSWASLSQSSCKGRLCPDTELEGYKAAITQASKLSFEEWLQTTTNAAVGTEINLQLGTFTLQSNQTELLDSRFTESMDVQTVIGAHDARLKCARVLKTQQCEQVRLMFRHDLDFWEADPRKPKVAFGRSVKFLPEWINNGLKRIPKELNSSDIHFEDTSGNCARGQLIREDTLFEVCLFKTTEGTHVNIFKVVSYGRRFLRALAFSSSPVYCLHDLAPSLVATEENLYDIQCGKHNLVGTGNDRFFGRGVVIRRCLSAEIGEQTFIPQRFLRGLLPSAILGNPC
jgi:hypothetical protein